MTDVQTILEFLQNPRGMTVLLLACVIPWVTMAYMFWRLDQSVTALTDKIQCNKPIIINTVPHYNETF